MKQAWMFCSVSGLGAHTRWLALVPVLGVCVACDELRLWPANEGSDFIELPPLREPDRRPRDAAVPPPDGAVLCQRDEDCDDGIMCTIDVCQAAGFCVSRTDFVRCSDGLFCNGTEACDRVLGCVAGPTRTCEDGDVCTVDSCDELNKRCRNEPRDFDADGEVDWHCTGGTDCDDYDATRGSDAAETCADAVDNDCDDEVDETDCGRPKHDTCDDALVVDGPGTYVLAMDGTIRDYTVECDKGLTRDAVFTFALDEPSDVDLTARGLLADSSEEVATVAVRGDCSVFDNDRECRVGFPAHSRMRAVPAGRYYAIVDSPNARRVVLNADFRPASEPAANTSCPAAMDVSEGGRFTGSFVDLPDSFTAPCGSSGQAPAGTALHQADLVYVFTTVEQRDVLISMLSVTDEAVTFSVRDECDDEESVVRCAQASPAIARLHELAAGTYYLIAESPSYREVDFELDVRFEEPTPAPPGDSCDTALPLALGEPTLGTLVAKQDEIAFGCQLFAPDTAYKLTVDQSVDLSITVDGADASMRFAVQAACGEEKSELVCDQGRPGRTRLRDVAPGDYYLVLESSETQDFEVHVEALERTQPVAVEGNGTCANAVEIPEEGGLFRGTTASMLNDYVGCRNSRSSDAAFKLVLAEPRTVTASAEAAFDTVLYRFFGDDPAACNGAVAACNDDFDGSNSRLDAELLEAGVHYYIVDGFSDSNSGEYVLDIVVN